MMTMITSSAKEYTNVAVTYNDGNVTVVISSVRIVTVIIAEHSSYYFIFNMLHDRGMRHLSSHVRIVNGI
jgi:hypothetical protein